MNMTALPTQQQFTRSVTYYGVLLSSPSAVQHHTLRPSLEQFFLVEEYAPGILPVFELASYSRVSYLPGPERI